MRVKPNIEACPHVDGKIPPESKDWYFMINQLTIHLMAYSSTFYKVFARMLENRESGEFNAFVSEFKEASENKKKSSR